MSNDTSTKKEDTMPDISDADIEAILSASADEEEKADDASDELLEAALQEVELETSKIDAYEEQDKKSEPEPDPVPEEIVEEEAKKAAKPKRKAKAKTGAKKARAVKKPASAKPATAVSGAKPSEILRTKLDKKVYELMVTTADKSDAADVDALLDAIDKDIPVKAAKKVVNLFCFLDGQTELSVFIRLVLERLEAQDGKITFEEIKNAYLPRYSTGTAGAHASQWKWIFDLLDICDRKAGYSLSLIHI